MLVHLARCPVVLHAGNAIVCSRCDSRRLKQFAPEMRAAFCRRSCRRTYIYVHHRSALSLRQGALGFSFFLEGTWSPEWQPSSVWLVDSTKQMIIISPSHCAPCPGRSRDWSVGRADGRPSARPPSGCKGWGRDEVDRPNADVIVNTADADRCHHVKQIALGRAMSPIFPTPCRRRNRID